MRIVGNWRRSWRRRHGNINLTDAHLIDSAAAATIPAAICRWLLHDRIEKMSVGDILACNRDIVRAKAARDAAVKALGIDVEPEPIDLKTYIEAQPRA